METMGFNSGGRRISYSTATLVYCSETMSITDTFDMHTICSSSILGMGKRVGTKIISINDR